MTVHPAILNVARETAPIFIGGHSASLSGADRRAGARRAVRQEAQARRLPRHREGPRGALRRQPDRGARRAAHAAGARHRRHPDGQGRRGARRARQSAPVRRGARGAARPHRRERRRDHGRAARDRDARRGACGRARDRGRSRQAQAPDRRGGSDHRRHAGLYPLLPRLPSRGRRGLAQPRAGDAAPLAAARLLAGREPHADAARSRAASSPCIASSLA